MASTHQAQIPLKTLSIQAKHAEIFPNLHSSIIQETEAQVNTMDALQALACEAMEDKE